MIGVCVNNHFVSNGQRQQVLEVCTGHKDKLRPCLYGTTMVRNRCQLHCMLSIFLQQDLSFDYADLQLATYQVRVSRLLYLWLCCFGRFMVNIIWMFFTWTGSAIRQRIDLAIIQVLVC